MQIYSPFLAWPSPDEWWDYAPSTNGADGAEFAHTGDHKNSDQIRLNN